MVQGGMPRHDDRRDSQCVLENGKSSELASRARSVCRARREAMLLAVDNPGLAELGNPPERQLHNSQVLIIRRDLSPLPKRNMSIPPSHNSSKFPQIPSKVIRISEGFSTNLSAWEEVLKKYHQALEQVSNEGSESSLYKHTERGQLLGVCIFVHDLLGKFDLKAWT